MIIEKIKARRLEARKERNTTIASVLAVIIAELDRKQEHNDSACIKVITSAIDNNNIALEHAKGDQVDILKAENAVLETILPQRMNEDELKTFIDDFVIESGANHMRFMGELRSALQDTGKVIDMSIASKIFKNAIGA